MTQTDVVYGKIKTDSLLDSPKNCIDKGNFLNVKLFLHIFFLSLWKLLFVVCH